MTKFTNRPARSATSPIQTIPGEHAFTHEGAAGHVRDAKSELFLLAVTNMVSENTFYESASDRDDRFERLIHQVTQEDPEWVRRFIPYLRDTMQMRSASIAAAAEYLKAGGPNPRGVIESAISRADEPAEMLAYWRNRHGRAFPMPLKRGVADATRRRYNQFSLLKYDGREMPWRFGDVIDLVHPEPIDARQSALFRYALDRRHGREKGLVEYGTGDAALTALEAHERLMGVPEAERRSFLRSGGLPALSEAAWTWERLSGWLPGGMDAEAWEMVIPQMGYMALLRNLRNFDQAQISSSAQAAVEAKLVDPEEVARSRQFPIRFLSAWEAVRGMRWASSLETALDLSVANVPEFGGRTLVLIDLSYSMQAPLSKRTSVDRWKVAAVFGLAIAKRNAQVDTFVYSNNAAKLAAEPGDSILRLVEGAAHVPGMFSGTNTMQTLAQTYDGHDRVVILTDEQMHPGYGAERVTDQVPKLITFNVAGYQVAQVASGPGRWTFGGLTDAAFRALPLLERGADQGWPF